MAKDSFEGKELLNIPSHLKNLLNRDLSLSSVDIQSFLNCSKNIDALRNTKSVGESTSNSCVSVKREVLLFDPETDDIIRNLDVKKVIHPSPSQGSSINHLFAQELEESNSPLSDVFNALSAQKKSIIYDSKQNFDFTAGILKPSVLKELGLKQDNVNLVSEGLKVNFKKDLDFSKLKPKPNNRTINRNKSIVRKYLNSLEESGSISKVNFKPSVISPLNLVPKPNGAPRLIHDLSRFNKFIARGPKVKHLNIFNLSKNFSSNTFFTKLDLRNGYFHVPIYPPHRSYFGFSFERQYYVFNVLCFGYSPAPDHFQHLMSDVCRILRSQGVPCNVELDDVIIYGEGRERSLRATHLAISILERAGFKINYSKSVISPTQLIDYLGYTLDARNQCFCLQKSKLVKCKLILKGLSILNSVSRKLMEQLLGFFNFIFSIVPLARSFVRVWYDQLRLHTSHSSRIFFDRSPLGPLWEIIFAKTFVFPWRSGVPKQPLPCFVDATPLRVAGISGKGCFSRSLLSPTPIFEAEMCAALAGIFYHLPYSSFIRLIGDNLAVLFVLQKGSCRNSSGNYFLQNLAKLYIKSPFLLDLRYIRSENNPADCLTRCVFPNFSPVWHA